MELIEDIKKGEVPVGNVLLTTAGKALRRITETTIVEGYPEMVKTFLSDKGITLAKEHGYIAEVKEEELHINRIDN